MNIAAIAGDAGGARAIAPVLAALRARGSSVACGAYAAAAIVLPAMGVAVSAPSISAVSGARALLAGTSVQPDRWELRYIDEAAAQGVRSIALIDHWVHYRERFERANGSLALPDIIAVADEDARRGAVAARLPAERVRVTGHPGFDALEAMAAPAARARAGQTIRAAIGAAPTDIVVLWASQPLSQLYDPKVLGFHEEDALAQTITALDALARRRGIHIVLALKRHPREGTRPLPASPSTNVRVVACPEGLAPAEAAAGSDAVAGMSSMLLLEAALVGTPALSHQPGLLLPDPLPSNARGLTRGVTDARELADAFDQALFDEKAHEAWALLVSHERPPPGATERVIQLLLHEVPT